MGSKKPVRERLLKKLQDWRRHPLYVWFFAPAGLLFSLWLGRGQHTMIDVFLIVASGMSATIGIVLLPIKLWLRLIGGLVVCALAICGGVYSYDRIFWPDKVDALFRYAYEECAYRGTVHGENEDATILATEPIKRVFRPEMEYAFRFGVNNGNGKNGVAMEQVFIQITFIDRPSGFTVRPVAGKHGEWQVEEVNKRFSASLNSITDQAFVVDAALLVKFPEKRTYKVQAKIDGEGLKSIYRSFEIEMVDSCAVATTKPQSQPPTLLPFVLVPPKQPVTSASEPHVNVRPSK